MLMRVCMYDYVDLVDAVLNLGAAIDGREIFGTTSLMFAARQGSLSLPSLSFFLSPSAR